MMWKVSGKLQKVLDRKYIEVVRDADVKSYMFMFDVPKGDSDVQMVYDGSKSGFNYATWAPWFALPTVEAMSRTVLPAGWCGDRDFGEMFLNFPLHPVARLYCGVDLSQLTLNKVERVEKRPFCGTVDAQCNGVEIESVPSGSSGDKSQAQIPGEQTRSSQPVQLEQMRPQFAWRHWL